MTAPQEKLEAKQKLEAMLAEFERRTKTDSTNPGAIFRDVLDSTPGLRAQFELAVDKGDLVAIEAETDRRFNGSYNHIDRTMRLSVSQINEADPSLNPEEVKDATNFIRYTSGHEINHALARSESLRMEQRFREQASAIANTPSPHDFTASVREYNDAARRGKPGQKSRDSTRLRRRSSTTTPGQH